MLRHLSCVFIACALVGLLCNPAHADRYEPNNSFGAARNLGTAGDRADYGLTILSAADVDYYVFNVTYTGNMVIDIIFTNSAGDLVLDLYDGAQGLLVHKDTGTDNERITQIVQAGQTYYVKVSGFSGAVNNYHLIIDGPTCFPPDRFEPNETIDSAWVLPDLGDLSEMSLNLHDYGDMDYYTFMADDTGQLTVDVLFTNAAGDMVLELYNSMSNLITSADTSSDNERATIPVTKGETYFVKVYGYNNVSNENYNLIFDGPPLYARDAFEPNNEFTNAAPLGGLGDRTESNLTLHAAGDEDYYSLTADETGQLTVDLLFQHAATNDLVLAIYDSTNGVIEIEDTSSDNETVTVPVSQGETYVIHVYEFGGQAVPDYTMVINGPPRYNKDRFENNNAFTNATDLLTLGDRTETNLTIHDVGDEDVFVFTAEESGQLVVDVLFIHTNGDLALEVYDGDENSLDSVDSNSDNEHISLSIEKGSNYYIRVSEVTSVGQPDYTLIVDAPPLYPVDAFEANNAFGEAANLGVTGNRSLSDLTLHDTGDEDYFLIEASQTGDLEVNLTFTNADGDVDLFIYNSSFTEIGASTSSSDEESDIVPVLQGSNYYIVVRGNLGVPSPGYQMVIFGPNPFRVAGELNLVSDEFYLTWSSVSGQSYQVHRTLDLAVPFITIESNIPPTPPLNTYTTDVTGVDRAYYRLELE